LIAGAIIMMMMGIIDLIARRETTHMFAGLFHYAKAAQAAAKELV
jgi:hypothetical protein